VVLSTTVDLLHATTTHNNLSHSSTVQRSAVQYCWFTVQCSAAQCSARLIALQQHRARQYYCEFIFRIVINAAKRRTMQTDVFKCCLKGVIYGHTHALYFWSEGVHIPTLELGHCPLCCHYCAKFRISQKLSSQDSRFNSQNANIHKYIVFHN